MAAPLAKGLIITASVLVAAGIAFYENEQIREWILNSRRKLAIALHNLGEELDPQSRSRSNSQDNDDEAAETRRRRRHEIIRLNRLEMVRQAREEGIAVDLDELMRIGSDMESPRPSQADRSRSFDELVGKDGTLRQQEMAQASGADTSISGIRQRGAGIRGLEAGASHANPFDDEAQILFDHDLIGADSVYSEKQTSGESTRTLSPDPADETCASESQYFSEAEMEAQVEEAIRRSLEESAVLSQNESPVATDVMDLDPPVSVPQSTQSSYYYAPPPNVHQVPMSSNSMYSSAMEAMLEANMHHPPTQNQEDGDADDELHTPTGTLTPTEDGFSTAASIIGSNAGDIGVLSDIHSMLDENEMDARSEATSETWSNVGASTPGSWTDVESEAGEEEGHHTIGALNVPNTSTH